VAVAVISRENATIIPSFVGHSIEKSILRREKSAVDSMDGTVAVAVISRESATIIPSFVGHSIEKSIPRREKSAVDTSDGTSKRLQSQRV
jgi:ribosomal protein S19